MVFTDHRQDFDTDTLVYGRGLNEIRKRAATLYAKLDIISEVNNGTIIRLGVSVAV